MTQSKETCWVCAVCGTEAGVAADDMTPEAVENSGALLCRNCERSVTNALTVAGKAGILREREAKTAMSALSRLANATVYETDRAQREAYDAASDPALLESIYCTICDSANGVPGETPATDIAVCPGCASVVLSIGVAFGQPNTTDWKFRDHRQEARDAITAAQEILSDDGGS